MMTLRSLEQGWRAMRRPFFFLLFILTGCTHVAPHAPLVVTEIESTGLPQSGQWRDGFDVADMNGDGHLDILHGAPRKGPFVPFIFLGDGKGTFARWRDAHFPPLPYDYGDIKAGDVNGDGVLDIALSSHLRGLTVLVHEARGHYAPWSEGMQLRAPGAFPNEEAFASRAIALADWNGDGALDVLALNEGPSRFVLSPLGSDALAIFLNRSGGTWQRVQSKQRLSGFGTDLAMGDVDGDGRVDAVAASLVTGARRLLHRTTGVTDLSSLPKNAITTAVAVADRDIFAATFVVDRGKARSALQVVRVRGEADTANELWSSTERVMLSAIATGDLDSDGDRDAIALRDDGALMLFTFARGAFARDTVVPAPERYRGCNGHDLQLADIDGDGHAEVIASYAGDVKATTCVSGGGFAVWRVHSGL